LHKAAARPAINIVVKSNFSTISPEKAQESIAAKFLVSNGTNIDESSQG
jgi:hypothetical protein